jgi:hypothetical protein
MTSEPSRPNQSTNGDATSSVAASPARTSATLASEQESRENALVCGPSSPGSLAWYDRASCSWRTWQLCLDGEWDEFSATWPRSGLMRNGIAFRLLPLALPIFGIESFCWPTPQASDIYTESLPVRKNRQAGGMNLGQAVRCYPTPRASLWLSGEASDETFAKNSRSLNEVIARLYPTPRADSRDNAGGSNSRRIAKERGTYIGRKLNPLFVEWLMGFPLGWTELEDSATPSCHK